MIEDRKNRFITVKDIDSNKEFTINNPIYEHYTLTRVLTFSDGQYDVFSYYRSGGLNSDAYESLKQACVFQVDAEGNVTEVRINRGEYPMYIKYGKLYYYGKKRSVYVRDIDENGKSKPQVLYTLPEYREKRDSNTLGPERKTYIYIYFRIGENEVEVVGKQYGSDGGGEVLLATFPLDAEQAS